MCTVEKKSSLGIKICIGYLFMLQHIFSHRPPLYDLIDKAEVRTLHPA